MKKAYPIILTPEDGGYVVYVPDLKITTQGDSLVEAIEMARDAIELFLAPDDGCNTEIAEPSDIHSIKAENENDIITLVDVNCGR